jgi:hypothetical protein
VTSDYTVDGEPNDPYRPDVDTFTHLRRSRSPRGFTQLPRVPGAYGGTARVYESSAATEASLWLAVELPQYEDGTWHVTPGVEVVLHLRAPDALALAEQLLCLLRNHYHGDQLRALRPDPLDDFDAYGDVPVPGVRARLYPDDRARTDADDDDD